MLVRDKKVGVWGYGVVGKAAVSYFKKHGAQVSVMEKKVLLPEECAALAAMHVPCYDESLINSFLLEQDYIMPSPGIDLYSWYEPYANKWLAEVDLFYQHKQPNIVAITGSVGKTTITSLLHQLYAAHGYQSAAIGNIGIPLLSTTEHINHYTFIELSSFQLEHAKQFAPDIAVISNIYANHFDRHRTYAEYVKAKSNIFAHQKAGQWALLPWELRDEIDLSSIKSSIAWHSTQDIHHIKKEPDTSFAQHAIFCLSGDIIIKYQNHCMDNIALLSAIPPVTFIENLVIVAATSALLPSNTVDVTKLCPPALEHRLEWVAAHEGINYYNDSKSTTPASTLAAIAKIGSNIILFLGGLSKGVDRTDLIARCAGSVRVIYCFGKEATHLASICNQYNIPASAHSTLEEAFEHFCAKKQQGHTVLFSPAGSSFDLFANYQERGNRFKQLVQSMIQKN